jgi:hypothetical protein
MRVLRFIYVNPEENERRRRFIFMEGDMRRRLLLMETLGVLLVFFLFFTACQQPGSLSSEVNVSSVSIAGVEALSLGNPSMDWMQAAENPGHVFIGKASLEEAAVGIGAPPGSTVFLAQAKANVQPYFVPDTTFSFESEDFLFVEVFSENQDQYLIYAIVVHARNPGLLDLTLDGRSAMGGKTTEGRPIASFGDLGAPADSPAGITVESEGTIAFNDESAGTPIPVTLMPEVASATARITTASPGAAPLFSGPFVGADGGTISGLSVAAVDGNYIYIEVKGDGTYGALSYYKLKMTAKKNDRRLKTAKFVWYDGNTKLGEQSLGIGTMGTHSFSGGENYGNYDNGAEVVGGSGTSQAMPASSTSIMTLYDDAGGQRPPANFRLSLELEGEDSDLQFAFDYTKNQRSQPQFVIPGVDGTGEFGKLIGFYWIAVEVTTPMGEKGWYKFGSRIGSESADIGSIKINDVALTPLPAGNKTAADVSAGYITYTVPANADMSNIKIEAVPPSGLYSTVSIVMAPEENTNIAYGLFDLNEESNLDRDTGINTTTLGINSGQFVYIRVLAEISWLYGGSGFVSATWNPARTEDGYTAYKFYKVRILRQGATSDINITGIKYKGTSIGTLPSPVTVSTSQNTSPSTDMKKNVITTTTTTTTWGTEHVQHLTDDYTDVSVSVDLDPATPNVKFAYALATSNVTTAIAAADFVDSGRFEGLESNNYIVIRATSEDGTNVQYYKIHVLSPSGSDYAPTDIKINGGSIGAVGAGNAAVTGATVVDYNLPTLASFDTVTVTVDKPSQYTAVAYALADANNTDIAADGWTNTTGIFENVSPAQYVYIRTIAADRTATRYYKVRLLLSGAQTGAELTEIRINGTSIGSVPAANTAVTGTNSVLWKVDTLQNLNNLQVSVAKSEGSSVAYAIAAANNTNVTDWANTTGVFGIFQNAQYLYIRVVSESGLTINYYKVRIAAGNGSAAITDIRINGTSITGETALPAANTEVAGTTSVLYHAANAAALTNMAVTVEAAAGASVAYAAAAANNTTDTSWTNTTGIFPAFTAAQWVYIRVISEDTITTRYYKVRVAVGSGEATITGITINGAAVTLPAPNTVVTGPTAAAYASSTLLNPVTAAVQGTAAGAVVTYAAAAAATTNTSAASFTGTPSFSGFTSGQYVVIRVVSQDTINTNYYKVGVIHGNPDAELEGIRINGNYVIPPPQSNAMVTGTNAGTLALAAGDFDSDVTVRVGVSPGASVAYGTAATDSANITNWGNTSGVFANFIAGQYVVVRVISQDGQTTLYYKVQLTAAP